MKKILLLLMVSCATYAASQNLTQMQIMSPKEVMESAQVLGKMVFEDNKVKIYDTQDQLIAEPDFTTDLTIEVDASASKVTISNEEGRQQTIDLYVGIDNVQASVGISSNGHELTVKGAKYGEKILLYSTNGTLLKQSIITNESTSISIQDLPAGTYIVIVNNNFLKLMKQ